MGNLRIDLVVRGGDHRLAIECDGDAFHGPDQWDDDVRHQTVLECLDWRFWRVRGSAFFRDPDAATSSLWPLLDSLGIPRTAPQPHCPEPHAVPSRPGPDAEITASTFVPAPRTRTTD